MKIKVVHITSSLKIGGAEKLLCELIAHMDCFEHEVIYFHDGPYRKALEQLSIPVYHIQGFVSLYDPVFFKRLYSLVKKINPEVIHTQLWAANNAGRIIGKLLGKPIISVLHNYLDQDGRKRNFIDKCTARLTNQFIAYSDGIKNSLLNRDAYIPASKITTLDIGIDIQILHSKACNEKVERETLGLNHEHFVIGSVGRFVPVRRYDLMIDAFNIVQKKFPHVRLLLVGIGEMENVLRAQVQLLNLQDKVIFIIGDPGYKYYQLFDCFSLTSDKEGPSLALLEAMSFGIPCVRTNIDMAHPVIQHEINGLLVSAGDKISLAESFIKIIENKLMAKKLGKNACKTVLEKYDIKKLALEYTALLKTIS